MAADGRPGDVNPVGWWWMGIVGRWLGCGLFPDELVEVVRHKVVVPVGGSIEVLGVGAKDVRNFAGASPFQFNNPDSYKDRTETI